MGKFLKKNALYVVVYAVLLVLILTGTFFDLNVSKAIVSIGSGRYYSSNFFAAVVECFAEIPVYVFPSFAVCSFVVYSSVKYSGGRKIFSVVSGIVILLGLNYYAGTRIITASDPYFGLKEYANGITGVVFYSLFSLTFSLLYYVLTKKMTKNLSEEKLKSLAICSLIIVLTAIASQIVTQGTKGIVNRARYRYMLFSQVQGYEGFSLYTPWYEIVFNPKMPDGLKGLVEGGAYRSFPSGHATASFMLLSLTLLPFVFDNLNTKKRRIVIWCVVLVLQSFVAFMRIVAGAHFLTDVCFGSLITFSAFLIFRGIFLKKLTV